MFLLAWLIFFGVFPQIISQHFHGDFIGFISFFIQVVSLFLYLPFIYFFRLAKDRPVLRLYGWWSLALSLILSGAATIILLFPKSLQFKEVRGGPIPGGDYVLPAGYVPPQEPLAFLIYILLPLLLLTWIIAGFHLYRKSNWPSNGRMSITIKWLLIFVLFPWLIFLLSIPMSSLAWQEIIRMKNAPQNLQVSLTVCSLIQCLPLLFFFPYRSHQLKPVKGVFDQIAFGAVFGTIFLLYGILLMLFFSACELVANTVDYG